MHGGQGSAHGGSGVTDRQENDRRIASAPAVNYQASAWRHRDNQTYPLCKVEGVKPSLIGALLANIGLFLNQIKEDSTYRASRGWRDVKETH